jgi:hypothetical protein
LATVTVCTAVALTVVDTVSRVICPVGGGGGASSAVRNDQVRGWVIALPAVSSRPVVAVALYWVSAARSAVGSRVATRLVAL